MQWGVVATVKAPADKVLAFVAHHLDIGAARIWLFFDDPEDPAFDWVSGIPGVVPKRCTAQYWVNTCKQRPEKHQNRQSRNAQRVYAKTDLPWLAHIDVDEFIVSRRPIPEVLAALPEDQPLLRIAPWEALHDADLPDDIYLARHFRAAMAGPSQQAARDIAFGPYAFLLPDGVLSHAAGKCFFRTGLSRFLPRIHGAFRAKSRVPGGEFDRDIALLHFHAENPQTWQDRLAFRLSRGAYQYNPALQAHLLAADATEIAAFYNRVQSPDADTRAQLAELGLLRTETLTLRAKVARLEMPCT